MSELRAPIQELEMIQRYVVRLLVVLILVGGFVGGCSYMNKKFNLKDDNILEELVEAQIKKEVGLDVDLTPETQER